jgi:hypothetical protein
LEEHLAISEKYSQKEKNNLLNIAKKICKPFYLSYFCSGITKTISILAKALKGKVVFLEYHRKCNLSYTFLSTFEKKTNSVHNEFELF